jgi:hypothetical protein
LKTIIKEPEETIIAREQLCKRFHGNQLTGDRSHNTHAKLEELMEAVFSVESIPRLYTEAVSPA